jgi:hypothetical protein
MITSITVDHSFRWKDVTLKRGKGRVEAIGISDGEKHTGFLLWDYEPLAK